MTRRKTDATSSYMKSYFLIGALIITTVLSGCSKQPKHVEQNQSGITNGNKTIAKNDLDKDSAPEYDDGGNKILPDIVSNPAEKDWIFSMGDHIEVFAFRPENVKLDFCVEDATVTKLYRGNEKYGGETKELVENPLDVEVDEDGNLLSDNYYMWLSVKVKSLSKESADIVFNSYTIGMIDNENYLHALETATEPIYTNKIIDVNNTDKEAAFETLQGGEEKVYQIGYLLGKTDIENNLIYYIGDTAMETPTEMARIIRLDKVVKE